MESQSQNTNDGSCSQHASKDTHSAPFSNQVPSLSLPFHPSYQFRPMHASHPFGTQFSFQELLNNPNIPFNMSQFYSTSMSQNGKSRDPPKSNNSQTNVANKSWTTYEDSALTKAWLYVSVDSDVGNNQKQSQMWSRILQAWKEHMGTECNNGRNINSLCCRWGKIQGAVNRFHAIYELLERNHQSGTNLETMRREAMRMYEDANNNKPFKYEHCWEILKKNPKWCSQQLTKTNGSNKSKAPMTNKSTINLGDNSTIDDNKCGDLNDDGIERPQGRKSCKEKKMKVNDEKGVADALHKLQETLEMQMKVNREELELKKEKEKRDFELREQIFKKEIELKEEAQRQKMKAQKRKEQDCIMSKDLSKLSPALREKYETYQTQILKEWENDGLLGSEI